MSITADDGRNRSVLSAFHQEADRPSQPDDDTIALESGGEKKSAGQIGAGPGRRGGARARRRCAQGTSLAWRKTGRSSQNRREASRIHR
jgi:hypothetical protein